MRLRALGGNPVSQTILRMDDIAIYRDDRTHWEMAAAEVPGRGCGTVSHAPLMPAIRRDVSPHELGRLGEHLVVEVLLDWGWEVAERNWVCPWGEADIIAYEDGTCVMVEVKTRMVSASDDRTLPELAVTPRKQRRYSRIASCYVSATGEEMVRFDVMGVSVVPGHEVRICHYRDAFGGDA